MQLVKCAPVVSFRFRFLRSNGIAPLPLSNLAVLKSRLYDERKIEVSLIQWQGKQFVRISVQGYNSQEDIDALVNALRVLLPQAAI